ncbi:MAG: LamG domain-containing protein [Bacteroidota bacterium]|nr:LamG domain-containing protein [Bacteroidota bacterium]
MKTVLICLLLLTGFQFGSSQTLEVGLLACYPFTGNANDQSGNSHHGTVYGPLLTTDRFNIQGYAYEFDGVDDFIDIGLFSGFTNSNDFSISVWIEPDMVKLQTILMVNPDNFIDRFNAMAYYSHNGVCSTIWDYGDCTSGGRLLLAGTLFSPAWQHWVFTVSQTNGMKVYKNGALDISQASTSLFVNRNRNLWIGGGTDAANAPFFFGGKIDDMRLYDRELTPAEVQTLYGLELICIPTKLPDAYTHKNLFNITASRTSVSVKVDPAASASQFKLFSIDGKTLFSNKMVKGGDEFEIDLVSASGIILYSFNTLAGTISGKLLLNR